MVAYQSTDYKYHFTMSCLMWRWADTRPSFNETDYGGQAQVCPYYGLLD